MAIRRLRLLAAGSGLIFLLGGALVGASAKASAGISAHLTSKSFTAAQARTVKLVYKFSSKSSRFTYVLSRKTGNAWSTVRRVSKRGSFRGSHTMTISGLFGSKRVVVGQYRLKLSGSANSVTVSFTIKQPAPPMTVKPEAGRWVATSLSGPVSGGGSDFYAGFDITTTSIFFTVTSDRATVSGFGFTYDMSAPGTTSGSRCSQRATTADQTAAPITNRQFSTPAQNTWTPDPSTYGTFSGTFDSPTTAHGAAWLRGYIGSFDCRRGGFANTGEFSWTATRQP
jgi:hypothetical protein